MFCSTSIEASARKGGQQSTYMEMSTRVYVTGVLADELAQRSPEVSCHQAVHDGVDG